MTGLLKTLVFKYTLENDLPSGPLLFTTTALFETLLRMYQWNGSTAMEQIEHDSHDSCFHTHQRPSELHQYMQYICFPNNISGNC